MKFKVYLTFAMLFVAVILALFAYTYKNHWILKNAAVEISSVNAFVREGPNTTFRKVAELHKADRVKALGFKYSPQKNPWIKIKIPSSNIEGYISAKLLRFSNQKFLFQFAKVNKPSSKLFPDLYDKNNFKMLDFGEEVRIFSTKNDDKDLLWFYIKSDDSYGYAPLGSIKLSIKSLPLKTFSYILSAIIILFFIVTFMYIYKKKDSSKILCENCGLSFSAASKFCPGCGILVKKSLHPNKVYKTKNDLSEASDIATGVEPKIQPPSSESINQSDFPEEDISSDRIGTLDKIITKPFLEKEAKETFIKNNEQELALAPKKEQKTEKQEKTGKTVGYKKAFAVSIIFLLFCGLSYWGWNEFTVHQLQKELKVINAVQSISADGKKLILSYPRLVSLYRKATKNNLPFYNQRYKSIANKCILMLQRSPSFAAKWVKNNRAIAWSPVGSEYRPKDSISDNNLVDTVRKLKSICETGIAAQDGIVKFAKDLGTPTASIKGMPELAGEVKTTAIQASELAEVGQRVAKIKGRARARVQQGLREIDQANRKIERYADLSTLRRACYDWEAAQSTIASSRSILSSLPSFKNTHQVKVANALVKSDRSKIDEMLSKIEPHVRKARIELAKAERQERTTVGRAQRTVGRFFNRAKEKFSQSRIGREITVSFKAMVLGTKMFYDMMDMNSSSDMMGWAMKYEGDMNQLMNEVGEVNRMDGWSLTGKNTFIEDFTNNAYEDSFHKK